MLADYNRQYTEVSDAVKATIKPNPELLERLQALEAFLEISKERPMDQWEEALDRGEMPSDLADWLSKPVPKVKRR